VEVKRQADLPDELWFAIPQQYETYLTERSDAFIAGLVQTAMALGEDVEVRGAVSPRLMYGLDEFQRIFHTWFPQQLQKINIRADELSPAPVGEGVVGSTFSGGIDSTYTLWDNLPENQPLEEYHISHCLFLQGYDISLVHNEDFVLAQTQLSQAIQPLGLKLVTCRTNVHSFIEGLQKWDYAHGPPLMAAGVLMNGLFKRFYVPASFTYNALVPWGSSVVSDRLFSTETLEIISHGTAPSKPEKLEAFAGWAPAHKWLRVCTDAWKRKGVQNCSRCYKCVRTRISLDIIGALEDFSTFDPKVTLRDKLLFVFKSRWAGRRNQEMAAAMRRYKNWGWYPWIGAALLFGLVNDLIRRLMPAWLFSRLKKHFYPAHKNIFMHSTIDRHLQENGSHDHPSS
jgi:hypothetical protein